ncbi:hypothetical protein RF11_08975 [Thelohanellus kitauei]|uniref:Uncharacterized protein n=1 Tax=Thelohanellus kitauei TaxID=669202 RepID=A0A0C2MEG6_THEKT|nr:hypothetical protein RF11_08975 [Thelohanellus kitauei]
MVLVVYVGFFAMRVSFAYSAVCAYNFGDRKGNGYNKMLAELNIKISLHGEFSNQQKNESGEKCDKIDLSIIKNPRIWYSFKSETEHEFTDRLHKHECKRHRLDNEDSNAFMKRAINTCKELVGYLNTVYCRIDADKQLNVVKEVILQDKVRSRIRKNGCHKSYSVRDAVRTENKCF